VCSPRTYCKRNNKFSGSTFYRRAARQRIGAAAARTYFDRARARSPYAAGRRKTVRAAATSLGLSRKTVDAHKSNLDAEAGRCTTRLNL